MEELCPSVLNPGCRPAHRAEGSGGCAAHQLISSSKEKREAAVVVKWRWVRKRCMEEQGKEVARAKGVEAKRECVQELWELAIRSTGDIQTSGKSEWE